MGTKIGTFMSNKNCQIRAWLDVSQFEPNFLMSENLNLEENVGRILSKLLLIYFYYFKLSIKSEQSTERPQNIFS